MVLERISHPTLFAIGAIGVSLFVLAFVLDQTGSGSAAGFATMYGAIALVLSGVGYLSFYCIKYVSKAMQRRRMSV